MKQVVFSDLAQIELNDATTRYELKDVGSGIKFKYEIKKEVEWIIKNPKSSPKLVKS